MSQAFGTPHQVEAQKIARCDQIMRTVMYSTGVTVTVRAAAWRLRAGGARGGLEEWTAWWGGW